MQHHLFIALSTVGFASAGLLSHPHRLRNLLPRQDDIALSILDQALGSTTTTSLQYLEAHAASSPATTAPVTSLPAVIAASSIVAISSITSVSDCEHIADPDEGGPEGCQCSGYTGTLPTLSGSLGPCSYSMVAGSPVWPPPTSTATSTQTSGEIGYPFTSTAANSAIIAYATTTNMGEGALMAGSSTTMHTGKSMAVIMNSASSVGVGTLTGLPLMTAVSSALRSICTSTPTNAPGPAAPTNFAAACGSNVAKISDIVYTDGDGNWYADGELEITVKDVKYFDEQSLIGMISTIASSLNTSSVAPQNTWTVGWDEDPNGGREAKPAYCPAGGVQVCSCTDNDIPGDGRKPVHCKPGTSPQSVANVPQFAQILYTQDTIDAPGWPVQFLTVEFALHEDLPGPFACADAAMLTDGFAALALLPGLDFLDFLALPALGVSAACALNEQNLNDE